MEFLVNLHSPVEFAAGIAGPGRVGSDGHGRTSHQVPHHPRLFDVLVEMLGFGVGKLEQGPIVIGYGVGQMLAMLAGDPGLGSGRGLHGALDYR